MKKTIILLILLLIPAKLFAEAYAFPGAVGFGAKVRGAFSGANDPEVCVVNTLTWSTTDPTWDNSTYNFGVYKGSLGQCLSLNVEGGETVGGHKILADSGLIIVFEVGGTINRNGGYINVLYDNISFFGQTAPAPGITLKGATLNIEDASDIIIQHLKIRSGESLYTNCSNADAISITQNTDGQSARIMIDHVSLSWGADETFAIYSFDGDTEDITLSNSIISESLEAADCHDEYPARPGGYALLVNNASRLTLYKLLIAHNQGRTPWFDEHDEIQAWDIVGFNTNVDPFKISDNGPDDPDMSLRDILYKHGSETNVNYGTKAFRFQSSLDSDADIYGNNIVCCAEYSTGWGDCDYTAYDTFAGCTQDGSASSPVNGSDTVNYAGGSYYSEPTIVNVINGQNSAHDDYFLDDIGARPSERDSADDTIDKCVVDSYTSAGRRTDGLYIASETDSNGCGMTTTYWPSASGSASLTSMPSSPFAVKASGYSTLEEWIHTNYTGPIENRTILFGAITGVSIN